MLLEKPLLNKQNYVGSYKAKLNSFMHIVILENLKNTLTVLNCA